MEKDIQEETKKLEEVKKIISEKLSFLHEEFLKTEHDIIGFKEGQRGTQFIRQSKMSLIATEEYNLNLVKDNPYFGKMVLKTSDGKEYSIYIGKRIISDVDNNIITYDWRSPICSVYYDYNTGECEYLLNGEKNTCEMLEKKQIIIKDGKLINVLEDVSLSDDEILLKYLENNSSSGLKSIIATIQKEQNKIIRSPLNNNYIVNGIAGSGKTTVALHRIAYLIYNESRNVNNANFMIIGPNKYFLNYIESLLPDLDISNVKDKTFLEIFLENTGLKVKINTQNKVLENVLNDNENTELINFKSSIEFINLLNDFIIKYINDNMKDAIKYQDIEVCSKEKIDLFKNTILHSKNSFKDITNSIIKMIEKNVKNNASDLKHENWEKYREEFLKLSKDDPRRKEILDESDMIEKEIALGCPKQVKDYFKFMNINPLILYIEFLKSLNIDTKNIDKKIINYEDISPLLYISHLFKGDKYQDITHLVIDEGQDLSMADYYVLKIIFSNSTFNIYGDINQAIYSYYGIDDWQELNEKVFNNNALYQSLNKGYRTTKNIADIANGIIQSDNNILSNIGRMGSSVKFSELSISNICEQINKMLENNQTIAVICKESKEAKFVHNILKKYYKDISLITENDKDYKNGIVVIPSYLAKGLEFDGVILFNANEENYHTDLDMKLLYVCMTRALNELSINYSGKLSPLLSNNKSLKRELK